MKLYKPPAPMPDGGKMLFLAGTIEQGTGPDWQKEMVAMLEDTEWNILSPRRDAWDATWSQEKDAPLFRKQVEWELAGLERADKVLFYFAPGTKSPISLLELGLFARSGKLLVVCPLGFWRKGNVDIVCEHLGIRQLDSLAEAAELLRDAC